jgi:hypothetical protein
LRTDQAGASETLHSTAGQMMETRHVWQTNSTLRH